MIPALDGRREAALLAELLRRARATLSQDGEPAEPGPVAAAILDTAARLGEEVTGRLDRVPDKQADNLYAAIGLGRDPAIPAKMPVAFKLSDPPPPDLPEAAQGTRLSADVAGAPVTFETKSGISLAPGAIAALVATDTATDSIYVAPSGVAAASLPRQVPIRRALVADAAAGVAVLQVDPPIGLVAGQLISIGGDPSQHDITAVDNNLVTIDPPLRTASARGSAVADVAAFAPFAGAAINRQAHHLYLGHSTLLDVASAVELIVSGVPLPAAARWEYYGKAEGADATAWQPLTAQTDGARVRLAKGKGAPQKLAVNGRRSLWLRASVDPGTQDPVEAQGVTIAVAAGAGCDKALGERCPWPEPDPSKPDVQVPEPVAYEAIAVTTPIVPNALYYPFGREPRIFDSFYIGCREAFGKATAEVNICIDLAGPHFGPLAALSDGIRAHVLGVGSDGILYRALFEGGSTKLEAVPRDGPLLPRKARVAAAMVGQKLVVAVASNKGIETAEFDPLAVLAPGTVQWTPIKALAPDDKADEAAAAVVATPNGAITLALIDGRLVDSRKPGAGSDQDVAALALVPVQDGAAAIWVEQGAPGKLSLVRLGFDGVDDPASDLADEADLALGHFAAWAPDAASKDVYVAGFDANGKLQLGHASFANPSNFRTLDVEKNGAVPIPVRPIAFEPAPADELSGEPALLLASETPVRLGYDSGAGHFHASLETALIGPSDPDRQFVHGGGTMFVGDADQGLLYRPSFDRSPTAGLHGRRIVLLETSGVPADALDMIAVRATDRSSGGSFRLGAADGRVRIFDPDHAVNSSELSATGLTLLKRTAASDVGEFVDAASGAPGRFDLQGPSAGPAPNIAAGPIDILVEDASDPSGFTVWTMNREANGEWSAAAAAGFARLAQPVAFATLEAWNGTGQLVEAIEPSDPTAIRALIAQGPVLVAASPGLGPIELRDAGARAYVPVAHALITGGYVPLVLTPPWSFLGPDRPANPALSWEYWNGSSWWALETGDTTGNLQVTGGISFTVPADLAETDVAGRKNLWVRARLVGGDYGEARVTVETTGSPPKQQQTVTRDISAIRAPYIVSLKIGYCALAPMPPEIVLTDDNLGFVERTGGNDEGLPFPVFQTVAAALDLASREAPQPDEECRPCPDPPSTAAPAPVAPAPVAAARSLLIGFDSPIAGDLVALYFDALPGGGETELQIEALRRGRFATVPRIEDSSRGLSEPGILAFSLSVPPDRVTLFGEEAHWLRLSPTAGADWSPTLRGVWMNAATAVSTETRRDERIGTSSGAPGQLFRLPGAPVDPSSLVLRVFEPVSADEQATLDAVADPELAGGLWVRWNLVPALDSAGERGFTLDAELGEIRFGDTRYGRIPPLGAPIRADLYRKVTGASADGVRPGDKLQPISSLPGVEVVTALDLSAGGSDVESAAAARARAPAKVRHGDRVTTLADAEEFVLARFPELVQARAAPSRSGVRLVVVGRDAQPVPATLRGIAAAVRGAAVFALAAAGRLDVVGPRLLPITVTVGLMPDRSDDLADIAEAARAALLGFFDPKSGGRDGRGWPVGERPEPVDVAAALTDLADRAVVTDIAIERADRDRPTPLPDPLPGDVLIRLDADSIRVDAVAVEAAQ